MRLAWQLNRAGGRRRESVVRATKPTAAESVEAGSSSRGSNGRRHHFRCGES